MLDGRFDPAFADLFVSDAPPEGELLDIVVPAVLAYAATLAALACLWLMSLP